MNRRFVRSLLLAALLVLLCTQVFAAQETLAALRLDPESGFTTRMEDTDGNTLTQSGVLNPDGLRIPSAPQKSPLIRSIIMDGC